MVASLLADESARFLTDTYLPRLARALETLPADDLWWRPHERVLSFGTILVHLEGNVRQWILSGLGGQPDHRVRAREFGDPHDANASELLAKLVTTVTEAAAWIAGLDEDDFRRGYTIQGFEVSGVHAVVHVVEHFAWHTGQAVWIAKARGGPQHGLAFYDDAQLNRPREDPAS